MARRAPSIWSCLTLTLLGSGCQHFERARECRAITKLVNPGLVKVDEARKKAPATGSAYRAIGAEYDRLAVGLVALRPVNRRVQEVTADYQKLMREAGHDARQFADALDAKDEGRLALARSAASRTMKHETGALTHLDMVCRGR